ncbi:hypothetical protein RISK_003511 [Rhodopirellula islandica]|uniref:Uncharacterized protein n=1 Tax=Rhodopirellula islandica TaxID=595434 RepID=A0A0J1BCX9_RHOIS|nr:hypothetical protein RISK_003511 [Rhodopirellula islandica]
MLAHASQFEQSSCVSRWCATWIRQQFRPAALEVKVWQGPMGEPEPWLRILSRKSDE